ncbi:unnamed protein product [Vitrella brassicaformis CCMP3155]|uniref:Protein kinase domain-containing protein n=1 Tax=Vitrella brassicaformis (strain CCMP3155) TaxID=1169540 RepID=A0A0G4F020_VITBC|nr:unnamed protein product [Vitrella brassicaformis CCMP3155]|eukprot:CEM04553.1 unnamed protein product [Vitrella brassicaformis CCMP3155]
MERGGFRIVPDFWREYRKGKLLGRGGIASVFECVDTCGRQWAVKQIPKQTQRLCCEESYFRDVYRILKSPAARHPNLVTIYDVVEDQNYFYIIMERLEGPGLFELLWTYQRGDAPEWLAQKVARDILKAVRHLQTIGIYHRDIKPDNITFRRPVSSALGTMPDSNDAVLLDYDFVLLVGRHGGGQLAEKGSVRVTPQGTVPYMAPEVFEGNYSIQAELYSTGILLFVMLTMHLPYDVKSAKPLDKVFHTIRQSVDGRRLRESLPSRSSAAVDLITSLLAFDVNHRCPDVESALRSPWLREASLTTPRASQPSRPTYLSCNESSPGPPPQLSLSHAQPGPATTSPLKRKIKQPSRLTWRANPLLRSPQRQPEVKKRTTTTQGPTPGLLQLPTGGGQNRGAGVGNTRERTGARLGAQHTRASDGGRGRIGGRSEDLSTAASMAQRDPVISPRIPYEQLTPVRSSLRRREGLSPVIESPIKHINMRDDHTKRQPKHTGPTAAMRRDDVGVRRERRAPAAAAGGGGGGDGARKGDGDVGVGALQRDGRKEGVVPTWRQVCAAETPHRETLPKRLKDRSASQAPTGKPPEGTRASPFPPLAHQPPPRPPGVPFRLQLNLAGPVPLPPPERLRASPMVVPRLSLNPPPPPPPPMTKQMPVHVQSTATSTPVPPTPAPPFLPPALISPRVVSMAEKQAVRARQVVLCSSSGAARGPPPPPLIRGADAHVSRMRVAASMEHLLGPGPPSTAPVHRHREGQREVPATAGVRDVGRPLSRVG